MWTKIYRLSWILLVVILIISIICLYLPKCRQLRRMQKEKSAKIEANRIKQNSITEHKAWQDKFETDPSFVEKTARESGMVKENEYVFKFTNGSSETEN